MDGDVDPSDGLAVTVQLGGQQGDEAVDPELTDKKKKERWLYEADGSATCASADDGDDECDDDDDDDGR